MKERPCIRRHPRPEPDKCRICRLALEDPAYRELWSVAAGGCLHLGPATGATFPCHECGGKKDVPLYACAVHGVCSTAQLPPGGHSCRTCADWKSVSNFPGPLTRNLLYYVYPVTEGDGWRWNCRQLLRRLELFNGRRLCAVATDARTDPFTAVAEILAPAGVECIHLPNHPALREVQALGLLLQRNENADPHSVTLWAHAKGVTRPLPVVRRWAEMLYETYLDHPGLIDGLLEHKIFAGALKKIGYCFDKSRSSWHYSGGWWWFRDCGLYARPWRNYDATWYGAESYPGVICQARDAGTVFWEGQAGPMNLYDSHFFIEKLEPAYERWKSERAAAGRTGGRREATAGLPQPG